MYDREASEALNALDTRVAQIVSLPLNERAAAFAAISDDLLHELQRSDSDFSHESEK